MELGMKCSFCNRIEDKIKSITESPKDKNITICDKCAKEFIKRNNQRKGIGVKGNETLINISTEEKEDLIFKIKDKVNVKLIPRLKYCKKVDGITKIENHKVGHDKTIKTNHELHELMIIKDKYKDIIDKKFYTIKNNTIAFNKDYLIDEIVEVIYKTYSLVNTSELFSDKTNKFDIELEYQGKKIILDECEILTGNYNIEFDLDK